MEHHEHHEHHHTETQKVIHRLSRAIGHLESIKTMVEEGRACAVSSAIQQFVK